MERMKYNITKHKYIIIAFLAALLPRLIFLLWTYPMNNTGDELFMFMTPVRYAGLDWTGLVEDYRYYGFGLTLFLTPLFKLIENPVILYRIMVAIMIGFQSLIAPVCYYIVRRFFRDTEESFACLVSVASSYFVTLRAVYVYNESIYILLVWLIVLFLLLLNEKVENKKQKRMLTFVLMGIMIYAMTIHSRAVTLWIALAILVVFYFWTYRKWLVSPGMAICVGGAGYLFAKKAISHMAAAVGMVESGADVGNTSVSFSTSAILESVKSLIAWIDIVLGQINTMFVLVGGIALFSVIVGVIFIWKALVKRKEIAGAGQAEDTDSYVVIFIFSLAAVAITILGNAFSWLRGVTSVIETGVVNDSMRAVTYVRYYAAYFGPVLMAGIVYSRRHKESFCKMFGYVLSGMLALEGFWLFCILPYVEKYKGTFWEYAPFSGVDVWNKAIRYRDYLPAIAVAFGITLLCYILYRKRKVNIVVGVLCCLLFYEYVYGAVVTDGERGRLNYRYADDFYEVLHPIDEAGSLPYEIYAQKSATIDTFQSTNYQYQFMFKNHKIVPGLPPEELEEAVFLTNYFMEYPELEENGYLCAQLEDQEYIHVKGEKLQSLLEEQGVKLKPYMQNRSSAPLIQFQSDVLAQEATLDSMESNGEEGKFAYGYKVPFSGGEVEIDLDLELIGNTNEKIGTVELWKDGKQNCIYSQEIYKRDFDENGKLKVKMASMCNATPSLEPVIYLTEGSRIKLTKCEFAKISNRYNVGSESKEDTQRMFGIVNELDSEAEIVYMHPYSNCELEFSYLDSVLGDRRAETFIFDKESKPEIAENQILVFPNVGMFVFNLIPDYTIIARTDSYTLCVPKESYLEKRAIEKGKILSGTEGISQEYFRKIGEEGLINNMISFDLDAGAYQIQANVEVAGNSREAGLFRIYKGAELIEETELNIDVQNPEWMTGEIQLDSYENFRGLRCELLLPKELEGRDTEIFIRKN